MQEYIYLDKHFDCKICEEKNNKKGFRYYQSEKGYENDFQVENKNMIIFMLKGKAVFSCNEYSNIRIKKGEIAYLPSQAKCRWKSLTDTSVLILIGQNNLSHCDAKAIKDHAELWLDVIPGFKLLPIRSRLMDFIHSVINYLEDGITCPNMHKAKESELSVVFRIYYSTEELSSFFLPHVASTHEFESFVMNNYHKMKGVKEFVDLSGMSVASFNKQFKEHFRETPYQWLIKQRAKHIYYDLASTNKNFTEIAKEYHFSDSSHFTKYCKSMFGFSPSYIRKHPGQKTNEIK